MLDRLRSYLEKEPEVNLELESERWKNSLINSSPWQSIYLAAISPKRNPNQTLYCELVTDRDRPVKIDIPTIDNFTKSDLAMQVYMAVNVLGKVDEVSYVMFATQEFKASKLLTFLNRTSAGLKSDEIKMDGQMSDWLGREFGLDHRISSGIVYVGSYGGHHLHVTTIESRKRKFGVYGNTQLAAENFSRLVENSLPHLTLYPLSVKDYLETVRAKLKFMPQDWKD